MAREEETMEDAVGEHVHDADAEASPALIAVHPQEKSVIVAIGPELRVFDFQGNKPISLSNDSGENIRAICFDAGGSLFASAANDKLVKVWATDSWTCIRSTISEKRVSALAISHNSQYVLFADKFGVIWIFDLNVVEEKPSMLLGHYCSIITNLKFSPDGQFIASADRDFKIRVTLFPKRPLKGAHEIQSFCLGHTDYVSCLSFIRDPDSGQAFLLSGSGDSTVCLWDFLSGGLLDSCRVGMEAGLLDPDQEEQKNPAVVDLCASHDGSMIAVAVQRLHGVVLLNCDWSKRSISFSTMVTMGDTFLPTSLAMSNSHWRTWTIMGASSTAFARVRSLEFLGGSGGSARVLGDNEVPGGSRVLECLQGRRDLAEDEAASAAVAAEEASDAIRNLLVKRQYSAEQRDIRKRGRGDRKHKERYK